MATYAKKKANNGGKTAFSHGVKATPKSMGKIVGAGKAPLPSQKKKSGSGVEGRGTRG